MSFPAHLLDEIRARLPVSQVVGRRVRLRKQGREYLGLSPFKTEKTPSFTVNDHKGFYHCFSSGEHGDIFTFVMKTEGLSFPEAVERLAAEAGVPLPAPSSEDRKAGDERSRLYQLLAAAQTFYEARLHAPEGRNALRYLEQRGLKRETIAAFGLGYAPSSRSALKEHLARIGFTAEEMIRSGMLVAGPDIPVAYDRFRNRVMFPILDLKDRVIAFGGRALDPEAPAKYLNSPETPLFHKGSVLFNAGRARAATLERGSVIVVEGYMDVLAVSEAGLPHVVAPLGTALTEDQLRLLWRMSPEPVLCFDGDTAGRRAAARAIDTALPLLRPGVSLSFAFLPDGLDPDDFIRGQGRSAFDSALAQALSLSEVLWQREWAAGDWSTPERRARLEEQVLGYVGRIADPSVRAHYARAMRGRLAQAWAELRPVWPARTAVADRRARPFPGAERRGLGPTFKGSCSPSLRGSRLVSGSGSQPPYAEALLAKTVLNHPWLLDERGEEIAGLEFTSEAVVRLRNAMLGIHAALGPLDRKELRTQLRKLSFDGFLDLVERAITHKSDRFAEPDADRNAVEVGFRHAVALHEKAGLRRALEQAERAWHRDPSEEALARICELRHLLDRMGREAPGEGSFESTAAASPSAPDQARAVARDAPGQLR